jgi:rubrerythrin
LDARGVKKLSEQACSDFGEIIRFAIRREEEAARSYGKLAKQAKTGDLKKMLLELQAEEKNHKATLLNLSRTKIKTVPSSRIRDLKISDYLVEEPLGPDLDLQGLMIYAARKELKSFQLYSDLALRCQAPDQKKTFQFLAAQEKAHKLKLETEYEKHFLPED